MYESQVEYKPKSSKFSQYFWLFFFGLLIFSGGYVVGSGKVNISFLNKDNFQTQNASLPENLDYSSIDEVYSALKQNYDGELKLEDLINGLKKGLANSTGNPYTEYLTDDEASDFDSELNGEFSGIGAELSKENNQIVVVAPISGFPADKAGLRPKDAIIAIDDESTYNMSVTDAVKKIRGEPGTKVVLTISRGEQTKDYEIIREDIVIPSVEYKVIDNKIGYIKISRFADDTAELAKKAANELKQQNVKGVVLDLRGNPGGLLDASVAVASQWLDAGDQVVVEKRGSEVIKTHLASGENPLKGVPTVVLIDEGSASASEILAGALKDNQAASLVGTDSYGKGSVQQLIPLNNGGVIKITIARWYTPNGRNIDKEGIAPDKKIDRSISDIKNDKDPQLDAALKQLN